MNIALFGATGMVGQGVLRECLLDPQVKKITAFGRHAVEQRYAKLQNVIFGDPSDVRKTLRNFSSIDACFFCLGVSSLGLSEAEYTRITYDLTLEAAKALVQRNRRMTFVYVSGAGTDSTEQGNVFWARVKGRTENALLRMPFKATFMFRPSYIHPMNGIVSKTAIYRRMYQAVDWLYPLGRRIFPSQVTTTEAVGRAMLAVAKKGYEKNVLETDDINRLSKNQEK